MKTFLHIIFGFIVGCVMVACIFLLLKEKNIPADTVENQFTTDQSKEFSTVAVPALTDRFEFTTAKDPENPFFFEKRTYLYTGKEGSYVDSASGDTVTGKILFDVKNSKNIIVNRRELMGEDFWASIVPEGKKLEINAIYGDIPGDGDIMYRQNIYIVTGIREL